MVRARLVAEQGKGASFSRAVGNRFEGPVGLVQVDGNSLTGRTPSCMSPGEPSAAHGDSAFPSKSPSTGCGRPAPLAVTPSTTPTEVHVSAGTVGGRSPNSPSARCSSPGESPASPPRSPGRAPGRCQPGRLRRPLAAGRAGDIKQYRSRPRAGSHPRKGVPCPPRRRSVAPPGPASAELTHGAGAWAEVVGAWGSASSNGPFHVDSVVSHP